MSSSLYVAFVLAAWIVVLVPGPTTMLVTSYALSLGRRGAVPVVLGVALGDATAVGLSLAGLGALLTTSAALFSVLKLAGAVYLVVLGLCMWRASPHLSDSAGSVRPWHRCLGHAWLVTALNPKGIVFHVAFLPQFLDPTASLTPQLVLLGVTFVVLGAVNAAMYALLASGVRQYARRPAVLRAAHRAGGSMLVGAGLLTAGMDR